MSLARVDFLVHWFGGLIAFAILGMVLAGIWRGASRAAEFLRQKLAEAPAV